MPPARAEFEEEAYGRSDGDMTIINCDMGESFGLYRAGDDAGLMPADRIDRTRQIIIPLCGGLVAVAKQTSSDPKMIGIIGRDRGGHAISE